MYGITRLIIGNVLVSITVINIRVCLLPFALHYAVGCQPFACNEEVSTCVEDPVIGYRCECKPGFFAYGDKRTCRGKVLLFICSYNTVR